MRQLFIEALTGAESGIRLFALVREKGASRGGQSQLFPADAVLAHFFKENGGLDTHDGGGIFLIAAGQAQASKQYFFFETVHEGLQGQSLEVQVGDQVGKDQRFFYFFQGYDRLRICRRRLLTLRRVQDPVVSPDKIGHGGEPVQPRPGRTVLCYLIHVRHLGAMI
jgi:hypothetical protein